MMKDREEIIYIEQKILPFLKNKKITNKWRKGICGLPQCSNRALPFQIFCEEHLDRQEDLGFSDIMSLFGFAQDSVKTKKDQNWLTEKLEKFAGFKVDLPKKPIDFVRTFFNIRLFRYQQGFFLAFISLPEEKNEVLTGLFVRQTGKNETVANAICYLLLNYRNIRIGIFAPTEKQAQAIGLQRVRERLTSNKFVRTLIKTDMKDFIALENGSFVRAFTANPNSQIEGFTLNIAVLDESQDITDHIVSHDIIPMLASTNGSIVKIGTAGAKNHFFSSIERNKERKKNHFEYNYLDVGKERPDYLNFVETIAEEMGGKNTPEFRSQFLNEWVEGVSNFLSKKQFEDCVADIEIETEPQKEGIYVAGLDLAKDFDEAVMVILRSEGKFVVPVKFYTWQGVSYADVIKDVVGIFKDWHCSAIAVDSTKEETFGEMLEKEGLSVVKVKFTQEKKSNIYKNLLLYFEQKKILMGMKAGDYSFHLRKLEKQLINLQKEWRGSVLRIYTDGSRQHDDYPDALALACWCHKEHALDFYPHKQKTTKNDKNDIWLTPIHKREFYLEYKRGKENEFVKKGKKMVGWENLRKLCGGH